MRRNPDMEKLVSVTYETHEGYQTDDAVVEYVCCVEDGSALVEIINIFLPDGISRDQHEACKQQVADNFYRT